ncbi:thiolase family protein [Tsukamurella pseudospumae]|uniref:Thiolase n=1 Tax=Tsukamurella pseudospumae TaxID=239498 RepID=A0A137ZXU3_9ACTN|nr:thiolase family protein [Tsukamurella pseudospumae]KXO98339.1 thiolase [Tsukamurella pseudospumae]KXP02977.1 thiolase [Tsukamurella pseudospumae]
MSQDVFIIGVGMTPFGVHASETVPTLTARAVREALADAGITPAEVEAAYFGNTTQGPLEGQAMIAGQIALRGVGFERIPIFNVENACASGSSALNLAITSVRAGEASVALAVGAEKMNTGDKAKTMSVFDGAYDLSDPAALQRTLDALGGEVDTSDAGQRSIFMDIYAAMARNHMTTFGTTQEQIAAVSSKNHGHSVNNPLSHYRKAMSVEEILSARALAYPLTVPMCSPLTDGAAAAIVCTAEVAARIAGNRNVRVLASVAGTSVERETADYSKHVTRLAGERAYERAGIAPSDVDVAEVHDATAFGELAISEHLGFFEPGGGGAAAEAGETTLGGRIPINTSGGLESKGHPLAATGLGQIFELVTQLRGEAGARQVDGARIALAENGGGFSPFGTGEEAVAVVTILKAP